MNTILHNKYDVQSFCFEDSFVVTLTSSHSNIKLNFGDRIVFMKFYEEELFDSDISYYLDSLGNSIKQTTLVQVEDSRLLKKIEKTTGGFYSESQLNHYILIAENHIMEIVSFDKVKKSRETLIK